MASSTNPDAKAAVVCNGSATAVCGAVDRRRRRSLAVHPVGAPLAPATGCAPLGAAPQSFNPTTTRGDLRSSGAASVSESGAPTTIWARPAPGASSAPTTNRAAPRRPDPGHLFRNAG